MAVSVGNRYFSFDTLEAEIREFGKSLNTCFWKREAVSLNSYYSRIKSKNVDKAPPELKYYLIKYACIFGGKKYKKRPKDGSRRSKTFRQDCPVFISVLLSADKKALEVKKMNLNHTHLVSEDKAAFKKLPQQRRLPPDVRESAKEMLSLKVNKKLLLQKLQSETGKMVTMKDLHNLAGQERLRNKLEKVVFLQGDENIAETNANEDVEETYTSVAEIYTDENVSENNDNGPVSQDYYYKEETTSNEPVSQEDGDKLVFVQNRADKAVEDLVREKKRSNDLKEKLLEESRKRNAYLEALVKSTDVGIEESRRRNGLLEALLKVQCIIHNQTVSFEEPTEV